MQHEKLKNNVIGRAVRKRIWKKKSKLKYIKLGIASILFILSSFWLMLLVFLILALNMTVNNSSVHYTSDYTRFSYQVEEYRNTVETLCQQEGLSEYSSVIMAIMEVSTSGAGTDPMQAADKEANELFGKNRGDIGNYYYSIKVGIKEFKELIKICGVENINDSGRLSVAIQAYHFDRGYIEYANSADGYSVDTAREYLYMSQDLPHSLSPAFAVNVYQYIQLLTSGYKDMDYPLSIHSTYQEYDGNSVVYQGVLNQPVFSVSSGRIDAVDIKEGFADITIIYGTYSITYKNVAECTFCAGDFVSRGSVLGKLSGDEPYLLEIVILNNGENIDPEQILGKVLVQKKPVDEATRKTMIEVANTAKMATGLAYNPNQADAWGCSISGFAHVCYITFYNGTEQINLPTEYEELLKYEGIVYHETQYIVPNIMYEGDILLYKDSSGEYVSLAIYLGESRVMHMTPDGVVQDFYNFMEPSDLIRVCGKKYMGLMWPLPEFDNARITSEFDPARLNPVTGIIEPHNGTDIGEPEGTKIYAAAEGIVERASYGKSTGLYVSIKHNYEGKEFYTLYYHCSRLLVSTGQPISQGDIIALVGSTGESTGNHLHFGIRVPGEGYIDAMSVFYIYKNKEE